ncbi:hypothetical protein [Pseudomonas putida]|uniref:hypothetical protein n=1 Tax=Pseudomonas putida TaxID=303 RepID=UPI0018DA01E9|nr:hypothetical protein [Pseudomonas putida]MBH3412811.1 hypothetical protein [Pseudomonas putida]
MLKPANDAHSIKAIAFVCEFDREIDAAGLEHMKHAAKRFRSQLPDFQERRAIAISFPGNLSHHSGLSHPSGMTPKVEGFKFSDKEKTWLEVASNKCVYWTSAYLDYARFETEIIYYFKVAAEAFSKSGASQFKAMIEYRDEFESPEIDWDPELMLRTNNRYLASAAVEKGTLWHNHCGFFAKSNEHGQILNNVKIEHTIAQAEESTNITYILALTLTHVLEVEPPVRFESERFEACIRDQLRHLRSEHKKILSGILTDQALDAIGFN